MENRSYFAIIPANVRYDKEISANAKLLYGEVTALCNEKGYCWASNEYFSKLYGVEKRTISRWVSELTSKGYLQIRILYKSTGEVEKRILTLPQLVFPQIQQNQEVSEITQNQEKDEFDKLVNKWCDYKADKGKKVNNSTKQELKEKLKHISQSKVPVAQKIIEKAIASNWNNFFELCESDKKALKKEEHEKYLQQENEQKQAEKQKINNEKEEQMKMKEAICDKSSAIAYLKKYCKAPARFLVRSRLFQQLHEDFNVTINDVLGEVVND